MNEMNINNIYIFLTPFHLKQISEISKLLPKSSNEYVFYNEYIDVKAIEKQYPSATIIPIPPGKVNFKTFFAKPFAEKKILNNLFQSYRQLIDQELKNDQKYNLILGQDKDVFVQILINQLVKRNLKNEIIAVDEGTGYYSQNSKIKFPVMKVAYSLLSPVLFKNRIRYVERYGTLPEIDTVYVRFSDAIGKIAKSSIKYVQIPIKSKNKDFSKINSSNKVLVLTNPFTEDKEKTFEEEQELLLSLFYNIPSSKEIHIKQHPREKEEKLYKIKENFKIKVLNKNEVAEILNFEDYGLIIHFGSSVIMDRFMIGYPLDHIVTFNPYTKETSLDYLFEKTNHIRLKKSNWEQKIKTQLSNLFMLKN